MVERSEVDALAPDGEEICDFTVACRHWWRREYGVTFHWFELVGSPVMTAVEEKPGEIVFVDRAGDPIGVCQSLPPVSGLVQ